ncbi:MAG: tRNA (adenosine(37)-N6)-threonylcarbamoyltransferase complex dimerization subunit type 1 TsaB [Chloroflexi bacterium]|nr:tRNA (adenosine(37)-N6)-threonylcarbamoyltransferase complex dimerization subunit type 1 TsaB [Chloroflexota bacterium]
MKILSLDTSGRFDAVGLIDGHRVLADFVSEVEGNSLEDIILNIDRVLTDSGLTLTNVDGLAVGIGPGFWTGVRVGITVGKILAYATSKPLCGISSLDALAHQARDTPILICPLVAAGRGNVYGGFYRSDGKTLAKEGECSAGPIEGLLAKIKEPVLFLGEAAHLHRQAIYEKLGSQARFRDSGEGRRGAAMAMLALSRFERGESDDALSLVPLYLKEPLAEALLAQQRKRQAQ